MLKFLYILQGHDVALTLRSKISSQNVASASRMKKWWLNKMVEKRGALGGISAHVAVSFRYLVGDNEFESINTKGGNFILEMASTIIISLFK